MVTAIWSVVCHIRYSEILTAKSAGDLIGMKLPGNQTLLILNSVEAAVELLDKRAATYSDRPKSPVVDLYVPHIVATQ